MMLTLTGCAGQVPPIDAVTARIVVFCGAKCPLEVVLSDAAAPAVKEAALAR